MELQTNTKTWYKFNPDLVANLQSVKVSETSKSWNNFTLVPQIGPSHIYRYTQESKGWTYLRRVRRSFPLIIKMLNSSVKWECGGGGCCRIFFSLYPFWESMVTVIQPRILLQAYRTRTTTTETTTTMVLWLMER